MSFCAFLLLVTVQRPIGTFYQEHLGAGGLAGSAPGRAGKWRGIANRFLYGQKRNSPDKMPFWNIRGSTSQMLSEMSGMPPMTPDWRFEGIEVGVDGERSENPDYVYRTQDRIFG